MMFRITASAILKRLAKWPELAGTGFIRCCRLLVSKAQISVDPRSVCMPELGMKDSYVWTVPPMRHIAGPLSFIVISFITRPQSENNS